MKKIIFLLSLIIYYSSAFSQKTVQLVITKPLKTLRTSIELNYQINSRDFNGTLLKISNASFCYGLADLEFIDFKSKKEVQHFPCTGLIDLKSIVFNSENSFVITNGACYKSKIIIETKNLAPSIKKGRMYKVRLYFNYNNITTDSTIPYYNQRLTSNELTFVY